MTDDDILQSARGIVLSWMAEWALMLRADQSPDQQGLDANNRVVDRHIDFILSIRSFLAGCWGYPPPPDPFPFQEKREHHYLSTGCLHDQHDYCKAPQGRMGEKKPAQCKFCEAECTCDCHLEEEPARAQPA